MLRRRQRRFEAEIRDAVAAGEALRPTTRRIWLEPEYAVDPIQADVEPRLSGVVFTIETLPVSRELQRELRAWAVERFDELYKGDDEAGEREFERESKKRDGPLSRASEGSVPVFAP
jgi:hypothetical protein